MRASRSKTSLSALVRAGVPQPAGHVPGPDELEGFPEHRGENGAECYFSGPQRLCGEQHEGEEEELEADQRGSDSREHRGDRTFGDAGGERGTRSGGTRRQPEQAEQAEGAGITFHSPGNSRLILNLAGHRAHPPLRMRHRVQAWLAITRGG